jgi:RNA-binding protein YlmH
LEGEDRQLADRLRDFCCKAKEDYRPHFTPFLTLRQKNLAENLLKGERDVSFSFSGGFLEAERTICAVFPDWMEEITFPIALLRIGWKGKDEPTHRDFLGAVLNLGIARDRIGDIVVREDAAFSAAAESVAPYLKNNLLTVGKSPVQSVEEGDFSSVAAEKKLLLQSATVASLRLDWVVGALLGGSRSGAPKLSGGQRVSVDWEMTGSLTFPSGKTR